MSDTFLPSSHPPPQAEQRSSRRRIHGQILDDPYAWLRDRDDPAVLSHLRAENAHVEAVMAGSAELRGTLYREIVARIPENDVSVPVAHGPYLYYERMVEGLQYPIRCRRWVDGADGPGGEDEVEEEAVLDLNALAQEAGYLSLGAFRPSPDHRLLAYSLDTDGSERYRLKIEDLVTGESLDDSITGMARGLEWSADGRHLFYATRDASQRPHRIWRHRLGNEAAADELVYEEPDERFFLSLRKSRSERYLFLHSGTHTTSEIRVLDCQTPEQPFRLLVRRRDQVEAQVAHQGDRFLVRTNLGAQQFRVLEVPVTVLEKASAGPRPLQDDEDSRALWQELVAERSEVVLERLEAFRRHLVLQCRRQGQRRLEIVPLAEDGSLVDEERHPVAVDEHVCTVEVHRNLVYDTPILRYSYSSFLTPPSVYDYDMGERRRTLLKRTPVGGGYEPSRYVSERSFAVGPDGTEIPISLVRRQDASTETSRPLLLYGYGSYGTCVEPRFSAARISLLDRGFTFAIAHVRGGGELGRAWYESGRLCHKSRSFDDFIAVAEHLVAQGITSPRQLAIRGGSAGGLLVGAVLNQRPDLFQVALAEVPFVDVLNTMLDPTIPLTVIEFGEWGDPGSSPEAFETIRSYSPYENVRAQAYPHLLVTAGLHDPRVQYWEPAKWVARLREVQGHHGGHPGEGSNTTASLLLLRTDLGSGHGGASGRYDAIEEEAFKLAFVLQAMEREMSAEERLSSEPRKVASLAQGAGSLR